MPVLNAIQRASAEIIDPYMKLRAYLLMLFVVAVWGSTFVLIKGALAHATPAAFNLARMTLAFAVMAIAYHRYWRGIRKWQIWAGAIRSLPRRRIPVPDHRPGVHYAFKVGFHYGAGCGPGSAVSSVRDAPARRPATALECIRRRGACFSGNSSHRAALAGCSNRRQSCRRPASRPVFAQHRRRAHLRLRHRIRISLHRARPCLSRIAFQPLALLQVGFCAVFMLVSLPFIERPRIAWTPGLMAALAIAAVLATAAAFSIQSWAQSILPSTHTALLMTMEPVFAWLTSFLVMGERLGLRPACGALIILAGIAITELVPQPHVPTAHEA